MGVMAVENTGNVTLSSVSLTDDVEGTLVLSDVARDDVPVLAPGNSETASSAHTLTQADFDSGVGVPLPENPGDLNAEDYVIFAQARDGKEREIVDNGSNDKQASVSGSENSLFGRIRSNADFSGSGQNDYFHYVDNGPTKPVQPSTVHEGKITFRFLNENGDNFYETPLEDPRHPTPFTDGTWLPVQSDVPVGPVGVVTTDPLNDDYQFWPGNLHTAVTAASDYLEMDVAELEQHCTFGSLIGAAVEFDLTGSDADGTYCTNGGLIKLSAQDVGSPTDPKRFTFFANDGLINISGQNAVIEPFALGMLAMSDLDSNSDQFPIKIAGSNFSVQSQAVVFASRSGVNVSGSDGSLLCIHAIGQEVKLQGSNTDFGPQSPDCVRFASTLTNVATAAGTSRLGVVVQDTDTQTVIFGPAPSALRVAGGAGDGAAPAAELTPTMLQAAIAEGINYWRAKGVAEGQLNDLRQMDVRVTDLPGPFLGFVYPGNTVLIDRNAAGHGWSVESGSHSGVNVHYVVAHELGHLLGFEHDDHGVMQAELEVGVRAPPTRSSQSLMNHHNDVMAKGRRLE